MTQGVLRNALVLSPSLRESSDSVPFISRVLPTKHLRILTFVKIVYTPFEYLYNYVNVQKVQISLRYKLAHDS